MAVWFEGSGVIDCDIDRVKQSFEDLGQHFVGVVACMPGMTTVELVDHGADYVTIRTNEGLMKRTNISTNVETDRVVVEYDEEYEAGSRVSASTHFVDEFTTDESGVTHHVVVSDVEAPGLLGFFYRKFGSAKMGKAFLDSNKAHFEA